MRGLIRATRRALAYALSPKVTCVRCGNKVAELEEVSPGYCRHCCGSDLMDRWLDQTLFPTEEEIHGRSD